MLAFADEDEQDNEPDEDDDADIDKDSDEDEPEDDEDAKDDDDASDEDDKPVTRKELKEILKSNQNKNNALRRVSSKKAPTDVTNPPKPDTRLDSVEKTLKDISVTNRKRDFGFEHSLSPKEVDFVFRQTSRPTAKFLETPYVRGAIEAMRADANVRNNTPSTSGRTFGSSHKAWAELSTDEKQQNFADRRKAILEGKKG